MLDLVVFLFAQLGNFLMFFDDITIFGSLSLLKLLVILFIFRIVISFLGSRDNKDE